MFGSSVSIGLIGLIRFARCRRPDRISKPDQDRVELEFEGESITVGAEVFDLYRSVPVRKAVADMVRPLEREGVNWLGIVQPESGERQQISRQEIAIFQPPPIDDEPIVREERRSAFRILNLPFKDENKWRLMDGQGNTITASMSDRTFLDKINTNEESFTNGDILVCRVLVEQWRTATGLRDEYTVREVVEHRSAAHQYFLPLTKAGGDQGE